MSYLYVNGCSFTWGTGLDNPPEENWGYFLGNKLELSVRNCSYPGQGSDEPFRKIYELLYIEEDFPSIIVLQLSELTRIRIFDDIDMEWKSASAGTWDLPKETYDYYWKYYYSVYQNTYYLFVQMLLLKDKCDSLGIEFYVLDGICDINLKCLLEMKDGLEKQILLDMFKVIKDKKFLLYNGDYSWNHIIYSSPEFEKGHKLFWKDRNGQPNEDNRVTDCGHPTKESHEFMANELYNFIKESK